MSTFDRSRVRHTAPSGSESSFRNIRAFRTAALASLLLAVVAGPATAAPFSVEGPVGAIVNSGGGHGTVRCNNVLVTITPSTTISSPTANLTLDLLADSTPFPNAGYGPTGTTRAGFVGGTCIIDGNDDSGSPVADSVFVEIAENVLVGSVTSSPGSTMAILGTSVVPLADTRMPAAIPRNQFGFEIDINTVPTGDLAAAEGYLGTDGMLYAHTIETSTGAPLVSDPRASIQRAECTNENRANRDRVEVRGGCVLPAGVTARAVLIAGVRPNVTQEQALGQANCALDPAFPPFGSYRFRSSTLELSGNVCPAQIRATLSGSTEPGELADTAVR